LGFVFALVAERGSHGGDDLDHLGEEVVDPSGRLRMIVVVFVTVGGSQWLVVELLLIRLVAGQPIVSAVETN
jgi:hypothetical protein